MSEGNLAKNYIKIEFPSKNSNISFARATVAAFLSQLDSTLEWLSEVKTIISEAVTNSIIHGYCDQETGKINVSVEIFEEEIKITVLDHGVGIEDVKRAREVFFSNSKSKRCGMGINIIESFCDLLTIESKLGHGTSLVVHKKMVSDSLELDLESD